MMTKKLITTTISIVAVLLLCVGVSLWASESNGEFVNVYGTVEEIIIPPYPQAATAIGVDSGNGTYYFLCYDGIEQNIRAKCDALVVGNKVLLSGKIYFGAGWIDLFVTKLYTVR